MKKLILSIAVITLSAGAVIATTVVTSKSKTECKSCSHCSCSSCSGECGKCSK